VEGRPELTRYGLVRAARQPIAAAAVVLLPVVFFTLLSLSPRLSPDFPLPLLNFFAVTAVSVLATAASLILAVASVRIGAYRVLFISLGFVVMGFLYAIDGLTTPGVLFAGDPASFERSVAGTSAFLGLCLPSLFFAAGYTRLLAFLERRLPFRRPALSSLPLSLGSPSTRRSLLPSATFLRGSLLIGRLMSRLSYSAASGSWPSPAGGRFAPIA
jgi:hypothetical protein